jgi:cyanoexosortase B-associated protein
MKFFHLPATHRSPWPVFVVVFCLAIAAFAILPNYFTGQWAWKNLPKVANIDPLRELSSQGLVVAGWQSTEQRVVDISGHQWSIQAMLPASQPASDLLKSPVILMLRPQSWHTDQPQMDWMDIHLYQNWRADRQRRLQISAPLPESGFPSEGFVPIRVRFFRGWNLKQTYAVVQWYAWSSGGHFHPSVWFWADQLSQLRDRHRMPWVAVSLLIPIEPLGDIELVQSLAESLIQSVQSALMTTLFQAGVQTSHHAASSTTFSMSMDCPISPKAAFCNHSCGDASLDAGEPVVTRTSCL